MIDFLVIGVHVHEAYSGLSVYPLVPAYDVCATN